MTVILIGGPARCGKSTLLRRLRSHMDGHAIESDLLRAAATLWWEQGAASAGAPTRPGPLGLRPAVTDHDPDEWIRLLRLREAAYWDGLERLVAHASSSDDDVLMDGGFWPDHVARLRAADVHHVGVFMIDTSPDHADRVVEAAREPSTLNNWQADWDEQALRAWAEHNRTRSRRVANCAALHGYTCFDAADGGIAAASEAAYRHLLRYVVPE